MASARKEAPRGCDVGVLSGEGLRRRQAMPSAQKIFIFLSSKWQVLVHSWS